MEIKAVSVLGWLIILSIVGLLLITMLEMFRNIWLNYGWSHPWLSSLGFAFVGVAMWWLFGLLIALSTHGSAKPSASAGRENTHQSATASSGSMINQATASDGSTINQAGGDLTVNLGLSEEDRNMIREAVKKKSLEAMAELAPKYPHGYVIFGLAPNGRPVTYESDLKDIRIEVDWNTFALRVDPPNRRMRVIIPNMIITFANGERSYFWANIEDLEFDENRSMPSLLITGIYYEVLDSEKRIFLVGFK